MFMIRYTLNDEVCRKQVTWKTTEIDENRHKTGS